MATPKLKKNATLSADRDDEQEYYSEIGEATQSVISFSDEDSDTVFTMPAGYKDKDGVIHTEFTVRDITGKDEEAISRPDIKSNGSKLISTLLARCVTRIGSLTPRSVGGSDRWAEVIRNLYVGDQDYMLLQLRKVSIGEDIEVEHVCPNKECRAKLRTVLSVDELEIVPFDGEREIPFVLPRGYKDRKSIVHREGTMRLPKGIDREILTPLAKTNMAKAETTMLTRLCKFNDGFHVDDDVMASLTIRDREYLQKLLKEHLFGVKLETEVVCTQCGETFRGSLNAANFI